MGYVCLSYEKKTYDYYYLLLLLLLYTWIFENRVGKNINSFYYLAI